MQRIFHDNDLNEHFLDKGYVKVPFLDKEQIRELLDFYDATISDLNTLAFHSTMHSADEEYRRVIDEKIKSVITTGIENILIDYRPLFANYIVKEATPESTVGIHQDWNYLDEGAFVSVNIWTSLVDTNDENGPLYILEGSQKLKTPIRFTPYQKPEYFNLFDLIASKSKKIYTGAGEAIIYNSSVIHYSTPNYTKDKRIAIGSVTIPKDATPLHYYRNPGSNQLDIYKVDEQFYYELNIGDKPGGVELLDTIPLSLESFSEDDLLKLVQGTNGPQRGFLKKMIAGFTR